VKKKQREAPRNNAVIYIRVSTQEQVENLSLDMQDGRCREFCEKNGWNPLRVFREEGQSAKTTLRDKFQQMLRYCKDVKNAVGYIVVYDLSRFSRNMLDQLATEKNLREAGIRLESVMEPTDDTAVGRWQRNMLAVNNQFDNDKRSERTIAGMTQAARIGRFPFKAPVGYINVSQQRGQNLIPDPIMAPLIRKAFELFATATYSKAEVLSKVNTLGLATRKGCPMPIQTFQRLLVNPIYAGWVTIPKWGVKFQGMFDPIVSQHVFDAVQDVLEGRKIVAKAYDHNNPDFPLRIFVRCAICEAPMTGGWSTGKKKKYAYYRCRNSNCGLKNIGRDDLEAKFIGLLQNLTPSSDLTGEFVSAVRNQWKRRQGDTEAAYAAIQQRLAKIHQRKNHLVDLRLDGDMDQATYKEQDERFNQDIEAATVDLRRSESNFLDFEGLLTFAEKIVRSPARLWMESSLDQRQRLQQTFFPSGITYDGHEFRTPVSDSFFSVLTGFFDAESRLASPMGFEPMLSP
jgi:DNA invertase Pin-like site-specific DNA recombinase